MSTRVPAPCKAPGLQHVALPHLATEGRQVLSAAAVAHQAAHVVAGADQPLGQSPADEAGRSGDECAHA